MKYLLVALLAFPSFSMAAVKKNAVCEAQVKAVQDEIGAKLKTAEEQNAALTEKVKELELAIAKFKNETVYISTEGYRNTRWGMSMQEVLALYPSKNTGTRVIKTQETVAEKLADLEFRFSTRDQLISAQLTVKGEGRFRSSEGYGQSRWGMSSAEVLALYPSGKKISDHVIRVEETVANTPAVVEFQFTHYDQLASVRVDLQGTDLFANTFSYANVKKSLTASYGNPNAGFGTEKKTDRGEEVQQANWDTGKTLITHMMITKLNSITHYITYTSVEMRRMR